MPRYAYRKLRVMCLEAKDFPVNDLRQAVEYLRTIPGADEKETFIGLVAEVPVRAGRFKLLATPMLTLMDIIGKTPPEVWAAFDKQVDKERRGLEER